MTGGEDSKLNAWVIHPIDEEDLDDAEGKSGECVEGEVDVDVDSPKQRKRDFERGHDRVCRFSFQTACMIMILG
jgi:hypothetical protein